MNTAEYEEEAARKRVEEEAVRKRDYEALLRLFKENDNRKLLTYDDPNIDKDPTGSGVRKYKQPKRQACKVAHNGMYGGLFINYPKLINEYIVEAQKGDSIVYKNHGDKTLIDLLTKRFNPKKDIVVELYKYLTI